MQDMINTALLLVMGFGGGKMIDAAIAGSPDRLFWNALPVIAAVGVFFYRRNPPAKNNHG